MTETRATDRPARWTPVAGHPVQAALVWPWSRLSRLLSRSRLSGSGGHSVGPAAQGRDLGESRPVHL